MAESTVSLVELLPTLGDQTLRRRPQPHVWSPVEYACHVRDVLLIFGYQSPTRFYYVHLSRKTDAVHNGIFLVNDVDRKRLDPPTSTGRLVDQEWHRVRLVRAAATGQIRVFFGSDENPILSAVDATLLTGRVGVGSFDETAEFRALELAPGPAPQVPSR